MEVYWDWILIGGGISLGIFCLLVCTILESNIENRTCVDDFIVFIKRLFVGRVELCAKLGAANPFPDNLEGCLVLNHREEGRNS